MHPAGDAQLDRPPAVMGNVVVKPSNDYQMGVGHPKQSVTETFQQEADALIMLQIPHVHGDRTLSVDPGGQDAFGVTIPRMPIAGNQQRRVLHPPDGFVRRVTVRHILQCRANGEDAEAVSYRNCLAPAQGGEGELQPGIRVDQLLRQGRVHIVDVRYACETLHGRRDEGRFLDRVDQVVAVPSNHLQALHEHEEVANDLLDRKARPDVSDSEWPCNPVNSAVGNFDIFTFVEGQEIDLVPPGAQEFEHPPDRKRSTARLKEWMGRQNQDIHPTGSPMTTGCCVLFITSSTSAPCRIVSHPSSAPARRAIWVTAPRSILREFPMLLRRQTISPSFTAISSCTALRTSNAVTSASVPACVNGTSAVLQGGAGLPKSRNTQPTSRSANIRAVVYLIGSTEKRCPTPLVVP